MGGLNLNDVFGSSVPNNSGLICKSSIPKRIRWHLFIYGLPSGELT